MPERNTNTVKKILFSTFQQNNSKATMSKNKFLLRNFIHTTYKLLRFLLQPFLKIENIRQQKAEKTEFVLNTVQYNPNVLFK